MDGKRFFDVYIDVKRVVSLVAWRAMAPLGVGRMQVALLREIGRTGPATQSALARATVNDPSATGRAVAALAARGWLRRKRGESDRREYYVELTPLGRRFLRRVQATYDETAALLGARIDPRDLAALERIRDKLAPLSIDSVEPVAATGPKVEKPRRGAKRRA